MAHVWSVNKFRVWDLNESCGVSQLPYTSFVKGRLETGVELFLRPMKGQVYRVGTSAKAPLGKPC